jgi:phage-related protein
MDLQKLAVRFFRTSTGNEPVLEWLRDLPATDRKSIGDEIRTVQFGWPIGMPVVRKIEPGLWEIRVRLSGRIARVLFTIVDETAVLVHAFIKKSQKIQQGDLLIARNRKRLVHGVE